MFGRVAGLCWSGSVVVVTASDTFNPPQDLLYGLDDDDVVIPYPAAGGALPAGLTAGTKYFVVSALPSSWKVSATVGGAAVDVTTTGTWPWYFAAHHEGVSIGQRGIAVHNAAARFSNTKFRVRAKTASGSNARSAVAIALSSQISACWNEKRGLLSTSRSEERLPA